MQIEGDDGTLLGQASLPATVHDLRSLAEADPINPEAMRRFRLSDLPVEPPQRADGMAEMCIQFRPPLQFAGLRLDPSDIARLRAARGPAKRLLIGMERPALSVALLHDAWILGTRMIVATPHGVLDESWNARSPKALASTPAAALRSAGRVTAEFDAVACSSMLERVQAGRNHYHFHAEHLCGLLQIEAFRARFLGSRLRTLLPEYSPLQQEAVDLLAPDLGEARPIGQADMRARQLLIPNLASYYINAPDPLLAKALGRLRRNALAGRSRPEPGGSRFIYVSRLDTALRRMSNEEALAEALRRRGATVFDARGLRYRDQVLAFADARVVVGAHGAGMTNIGFAAPGALVVEIFPAYFVFPYFARLAEYAGHRYRFYGQATPDSGPANDYGWSLDLDALLRFLDPLLEQALA